MPNTLIIATAYLLIHNYGMFSSPNDTVIPYNSMQECLKARQYFIADNEKYLIPGSVENKYECIPGSASSKK